MVPEDGAIGWVDNWAIASGSQNEELAYAFINYMISKDVQYDWAQGRPRPRQPGGRRGCGPRVRCRLRHGRDSLNRLYFMAYQDDATKAAWAELWTEVKAS